MGAILAPQTRGSKAASTHLGDGGEDSMLRLCRENNLFSDANYFILFFHFLEPDPLKIDEIVLPLRSPLVACHYLSLCCYPHVFLVGCYVLFDVWRPPKAMTYFFYY